MANVKFLKFVSAIAGTKELLFDDVPEGLSFSRNHLRPVSQRRTQNGSLISQNINYNKKIFSINGGIFVSDLASYFKTIFENNETITFTIYDYNASYVLINEAVHNVKMLNFEDSKDFSGSTRNFSFELQEI